MSLPFKLPFLANPGEGAELPKPEEVAAALTAFPPRLSVAQSVFSVPEDMFEKAVESMTKTSPPPGPNKVLVSLMKSFESAAPSLPLPGAGGAGAGGAKTEAEQAAEKAAESLRSSRPARFEIK
jgi:hypothetical protein